MEGVFDVNIIKINQIEQLNDELKDDNKCLRQEVFALGREVFTLKCKLEWAGNIVTNFMETDTNTSQPTTVNFVKNLYNIIVLSE